MFGLGGNSVSGSVGSFLTNTSKALKQSLSINSKTVMPMLPIKVPKELQSQLQSVKSKKNEMAKSTSSIYQIAFGIDIKQKVYYDYTLLRNQYGNLKVNEVLNSKIWEGLLDDEGRLTLSELELKKFIYYGRGIHPDIRDTVWSFILELHSWRSTKTDRENISYIQRQEYFASLSEWKAMLTEYDSSESILNEPVTGAAGDEQEDIKFMSKLKERKYRIEKDVVRTQQNCDSQAGLESDMEKIQLDSGSLIDNQPRLSLLRNILMSNDFII
jgi:hypothetical protein